MKNKYFNDGIIGNKKMLASFSKKGELLRLYYPNADYKQFIDYFETGLKINDSNLIKIHDDINNKYNQYYSDETNVLNTEIENSYFNLFVKQEDFVPMTEDVLVKRYIFTNNNQIDLNIKFLADSKLLTNVNNSVGARICDNTMLQYTHDFAMATFSNYPVYSYQINNVKDNIWTGEIKDKDYIGQSNHSAVSYDIGILKPGESKEFNLFIYINKNYKIDVLYTVLKEIEKIKKFNTLKLLMDTKNYWRKFVNKYDVLKIKDYAKEYGFGIEYNVKIKQIITRTILLYALLLNDETGGIVAAMEVDEEHDYCGRYGYCWPRDAVTISQALDMLGMYDVVDKFYKVFLRKTQSKNGMWEQRFYTDGRLAPCWGYQIDETASVVVGLYQHYKIKEFRQKMPDVEALQENLDMCENAVEFLKRYIDNLIDGRASNVIPIEEKYSYLNRKQIYTHVSYDLWEMNEGIHLYSLSSIYAAFKSMDLYYKELKKYNRKFKMPDNISELTTYAEKVKKYILENLVNKDENTLRRNTNDFNMDISIVGAVTPFGVFRPDETLVQNTIEKINLTLRTYTSGYLRFENDNYMGGRNPWPVSTLWMYTYYKLLGNEEEAKKCFKFVIDTSTKQGLLAEQIDNESMQPNWVIGLAWSHAMFVLAVGLEEYLK